MKLSAIPAPPPLPLPRPTRLTRLAVGCAMLLIAAMLSAQAEPEPVTVRTVALGTVLETPTFSAPATVVPRHAPRIAAEIGARIVAIPVEVGDRVAAGDPLARLDCRRFEAVLGAAEAAAEQARAQRQFAERQLSRARNLKQNDSISEELFDQRRTELASSTAAVQAAEENARQAALDVAHCVVQSPLAAVVSERHASVGDYVTPGAPVVDLIETAGQEVAVELREDQLASFRSAPALWFETGGERYPVVLRALLPAVDSISRTRTARLRFSVAAADPGTAGRLAWRGSQAQIPADFLLRRDGVLGVFVVEQDRARFVALPGAVEGRPADADLAPGLRLVTEGRQRLYHGVPVRLADDGTAS